MKRNSLGLAGSAGALAAVIAAAMGSAAVWGQAQQKWTTYKVTNTDNHYSYTVQYPPGWHVLMQSLTDLTVDLAVVNYVPEEDDQGLILDPAGHSHGSPAEVAGQAELTIDIHPPDVGTEDEWIFKDLRDLPIINDERIPIPRPVAKGCLRLRRVTVRDEFIGKVFVEVYHYCTTKAGLYELLLTTRPDNPNQDELEATALKAMLSLRAP